MRIQLCQPWTPLRWLVTAIALAACIAANSDAQTRFAVERSGAPGAPALLLIPGLATPGEVWAGTIAELGASADIYTLTAAGFGDVPAAGEGAFLEPLVAELADYLDTHHLESLTIVGHSMGGQVALQLAAARPERIDRVVIVDSAPFFMRLFNPAATAEQAAQYGPMMAAQLAAMPREQYLEMSRQGLAIQSITPEGQARVMGWMENADQATVARAMGEIAGSDFSPVLMDVRAEATVLVAWSDAAPVPAEQLRAMYEAQYAGLPGTQVQIIPDSRHFIMLDQPAAFLDALRAVLPAAN
ncbi:alpha/beta fold hydrolase [Maricaulis sp.]|uniref:alpha/beta fold hydrolase n=1 Tax=Maricaulis sp. TaxID=1486257 RepID=UPI003A8FB08A